MRLLDVILLVIATTSAVVAIWVPKNSFRGHVEYRRLLIGFAAPFFSLLVIAIAINVVIDPYAMFKVVRIRGINQFRPGMGNHNLHFKALDIVQKKPSNILLGSSVVDGGFVLPGHSGFESWRGDVYWSGLNERLNRAVPDAQAFYNLGIRDGGLYEALEFLEHAHVNNRALKRVILGIEFNLVTDAKKPIPIRALSPIMGMTSYPISVFFERVLTWNALRDSSLVLQENLREKIGKLDLARVRRSLKEFVSGEKSEVGIVKENLNRESIRHSIHDDNFPVRAPSTAETRLFYFANILNVHSGHNNGLVRKSAVRPDSVDLIRKIVEFCRLNGIQLDVYVSPQHGLNWLAVEKEGMLLDVFEFHRSLAAITPFWDFSGLVDFSENVTTLFSEGPDSGDPLHFTPAVGELILATILKGPQDRHSDVAFVSAQDVEDNFEQWKQRKRKWSNNRKYFANLFASLDPLKDEHVLPVVHYPDINGFRVVEVLGKSFAAPKEEFPLDLLRTFTRDYANLIEGSTPDNVRKSLSSLN